MRSRLSHAIASKLYRHSNNGDGTGPHQCSAAATSKGTIAFLLSGPDLYYQYGLKGAEAAAAKLGYTVKAYPNPNISPSVELANVKDAIALVWWPSTVTRWAFPLRTPP